MRALCEALVALFRLTPVVMNQTGSAHDDAAAASLEGREKNRQQIKKNLLLLLT
jgi:hypothetical protein